MSKRLSDYYNLKAEKDLNECLFNVFWHILGLACLVTFGIGCVIVFN